ncbi:MAG: FHA domain-containing protein [Candidatus Latescibacteria bacterium]|nr:FHA domain-containing protein [Candidatus Latescibacterota bacterium]
MHLYILNGENEGKRIDLSEGTYLIGRSSDADIVISNDQYVSGFHADLICSKDGKVFLADHNSKNGTYLLGDPVVKSKQVQPGDIFRIGHTFFKFSRRIQERTVDQDVSHDTIPEAIIVIDLVGSSNIAQAMGDRIASKVKNTLLLYLNKNLKKYPAEYIKNTGDGFLIIVSKVKPAIMLAKQFLSDLKDQKSFGGIRVRIGIHYGETSKLPDGDRRGMAVDMAFRVESVKVDDMHQTVLGIKKDEMPRSDRIFITEVVQNMVSNDQNIRTRCIGFFDLKGFTGRHKIFEVQI